MALAPGSALQVPQGPLQVPYRTALEPATGGPLASTACGRANSARREPGSRRCEVSQHDLSLRVCARQMANCSGAAKNSELRRAQDSLLPAAAGVDENGLTLLRGGAANEAPGGPDAASGDPLEGTLRHGCHACGKAREKTAGQISRHRTIRQVAGGPREQTRRRRRALIGPPPSRTRRLGIAAYCYPVRQRGGTTFSPNEHCINHKPLPKHHCHFI